MKQAVAASGLRSDNFKISCWLPPWDAGTQDLQVPAGATDTTYYRSPSLWPRQCALSSIDYVATSTIANYQLNHRI